MNFALCPVGFFWDLENCQVPQSKSAFAVVQRLRAEIGSLGSEVEFLVICDATKEKPEILNDLNLAQVNVSHVSATSKNAVDEKLKAQLRKFGSTYCPPGTVVLVSSDINFAPELSDLRYRLGFHTILIHGNRVSKGLLACADRKIPFADLLASVPATQNDKDGCSLATVAVLVVENLPAGVSPRRIRDRLRMLSDNCGGKVQIVDTTSNSVTIKFTSFDHAQKAVTRLNGCQLFGSVISVRLESSSSHLCEAMLQVHKVKYETAETKFEEVDAHYSERPCNSDQMEQYSRPVVDQKAAVIDCRSGGSVVQRLKTLQCATRGESPVHSSSERRRSYDQFERTNGNSYAPFLPIQHSSPKTSTTVGMEGFDNQHWAKWDQDDGLPKRGPVDLQVTNLDNAIHIKDLKRELYCAFDSYVKVLHVTVIPQSDGDCHGVVQVASMTDATVALERLQGHKIGAKRIAVTFWSKPPSPGPRHPLNVREAITDVLSCSLGKAMPLFQFLEQFRERFGQELEIDMLYSLRDTITIVDGGAGRTIYLNPKAAMESMTKIVQEKSPEICELHPVNARLLVNWRDHGLSKVSMSLKRLAANIHCLLESHGGAVPLASLLSCYRAECGSLPLCGEEEGVPLEHLLRCLPGIDVKVSDTTGFKQLQWATKSDEKAQKLPQRLEALADEFVQLFLAQPGCMIALPDLPLAYKQCYGRLLDPHMFGVDRLAQLLQMLQPVVNVLGSGSRKAVMLTHRVLMNQFLLDLRHFFKIHLEQSDRNFEASAGELSIFWDQYMNRQLRPEQYGVCTIQDLLDSLPTDIFMVSGTGDTALITLLVGRPATSGLCPGFEQREERKRVSQIKQELCELLRQEPHCRLAVSRLPVSYEQHFKRRFMPGCSRQRVLSALQMCTPEIQLVDSAREPAVTLNETEVLRVLADRMSVVLSAQESQSLPLHRLIQEYNSFYGFTLRLSDFDCSDVEELVSKLKGAVKLDSTADGSTVVQLGESRGVQLLRAQVLVLFLDCPDLVISWADLCRAFARRHGVPLCSVERVRSDCSDVVEVSADGKYVQLVPCQVFALQARLLLLQYGGTASIVDFEQMYRDEYGVRLQASDFGFASLTSLVRSVSNVLYVKGRGRIAIICMNRNFLAPLGHCEKLSSGSKNANYRAPHDHTGMWSAQRMKTRRGRRSRSGRSRNAWGLGRSVSAHGEYQPRYVAEEPLSPASQPGRRPLKQHTSFGRETYHNRRGRPSDAFGSESPSFASKQPPRYAVRDFLTGHTPSFISDNDDDDVDDEIAGADSVSAGDSLSDHTQAVKDSGLDTFESGFSPSDAKFVPRVPDAAALIERSFEGTTVSTVARSGRQSRLAARFSLL